MRSVRLRGSEGAGDGDAPAEDGMTPQFTQRLRQLDLEVEYLRAALEALQRHLATQTPQAGPAPRAWAGDADEYLRAYS